MNSQSNRNCNDFRDERRDDHRHCDCPRRFAVCQASEDLHPLPCPAILECGEGFNPRITAEFPPEGSTTTLQLAEVDIDTTCLCSPNIKIEFSTLIQFNVTGAADPIVIQLSRTCDNGSRCCVNGTRKVLRTYSIGLAEPGGGTTTLPFSFVFCAEDVKSQECVYSVDIISANPGEGATAFIQFENTDIAALAVGCERKCERRF